MELKTILVTGATGAQGGSVATHLLRRGGYEVRCFTRNPKSDAALRLKRAGADVVRGDLADAGSIRTAMEGCYGVFGVTAFSEHFEREFQHGKNLVDAVAAAGVQHFVFSTLGYPDTAEKNLPVPHIDLKAKLEDHCRSLNLPATYVHVAFYYENFLTFFPPRARGDGTYIFGFPQGTTPLAAVAAEDVGGVVGTIFDLGDQYKGTRVGIVGDDRPCGEYAETMSRATGERIVYTHVPREAFAGLGFPGAEDLANMFDLNRRIFKSRKDDVAESRTLYPQIRTFEQWAEANGERLRTALHSGAGAGAA